MPDSCLVAYDAQLAQSASLQVVVGGGGGVPIDFQFPPKIVSDTNNSMWNEWHMTGIEPIPYHTGSGGRKLVVEWEYIATGDGYDGPAIAEILRALKSYFFDFQIGDMPIVKFQYSGVVPDAIDFRLMQCQITHGPEMVGSGSSAYPLYTKVQISISMVTTGSAPDDPEPKNPQAPLQAVQPTWY